MIKFTIDGKKIRVPKGTTVLDAAKKYGIEIPTLCHHPKLTSYGGCRLCIVEVKGIHRPVTACTTPVNDDMDVTTVTPQLEKIRRTILELLLSDHPNDCMVCEMAGDCTLQELAYFYGMRENRFAGERRIYEKRDGNPLIERDMEKCILCNKCVRVCDEIQGVQAIDLAYRGFNAKVCPPYERMPRFALRMNVTLTVSSADSVSGCVRPGPLPARNGPSREGRKISKRLIPSVLIVDAGAVLP
jgi:NADH dehydrogenase/NADH:ubiquinone oxidoreductase subunit G